MDVKCLLWHSECAEYAFLKIVSLHSYFCRYVYRCLKSCFASFVTKGKSISSISLVYQNLHFFLIGIPQIGVSLSYFVWTQKPSFFFFFFFSIFIFIQKTFSELIYSDTSAKKSMFFSDKGVLKTKLHQILFKKSRGAYWYCLA